MDPTPLPLGLAHTDANQHVNSLVYPRLFEEAVLRRLATLGKPTALLTRRAEVAFRKPAFAGEVLTRGGARRTAEARPSARWACSSTTRAGWPSRASGRPPSWSLDLPWRSLAIPRVMPGGQWRVRCTLSCSRCRSGATKETPS